jgi:hypothetical protein
MGCGVADAGGGKADAFAVVSAGAVAGGTVAGGEVGVTDSWQPAPKNSSNPISSKTVALVVRCIIMLLHTLCL